MTETGARVWARLTLREREALLLLVADSAGYGVLAEQMGISWETLKNYVTKLFNKTGTDNRTDLMGFAVRHGLAPCPFCVREGRA